MEKNCDALAVRLWIAAYPDVDHESIVEEVLGRRLSKHLRDLPRLGNSEYEMSFDPDYTYKRVDTVMTLTKQALL